jgi:hypothetical protein
MSEKEVLDIQEYEEEKLGKTLQSPSQNGIQNYLQTLTCN